jgi:hypothetical protein
MLKKYIKTTCSFLATAGAFFFAGAAYSAGMTIGQPQYDVTQTAGQSAALTDTPMAVTTTAPAGVPAQASGSAKPSSPSTANADREVFREDAVPAK